MKRLLYQCLLTFLLAICALHIGMAQNCTPASNLPDSVIGPIPRPFHPQTNPTGGISDTACVNTNFQFVVTLVVPRVYSILGVDLPIQRFAMDTVRGITNLPKGVKYTCNPPTCNFVGGTSGCILLNGVVNDTAGIYDLKISGNIDAFIFSSPVSFPDSTLYRGNYFLHVKPEGQCNPVGVNELEKDVINTINRPNPFSSFTQIVIQSKISGEFNFIVNDLVGKQVHRERVNVWEGENAIQFDGSQLAAGVYIYNFRNNERTFSGKMIKN